MLRLGVLHRRRLAGTRTDTVPGMIFQVRGYRGATDNQGVAIVRITRRAVADGAFILGINLWHSQE